MDAAVRTESTALADPASDAFSDVSWASIAAGAVVAAAVSLALLALGSGLGLSSISPWSTLGVPASTFKRGRNHLVIVAVMSSAIGGYLAARLLKIQDGLI